MDLLGNKGEWGEIYIFLKLMYDGEVYAADKDMNKLNDVFLKIVKIIREEIRTQVYEYYTGDIIRIHLNGVDINTDIPKGVFEDNRDKLQTLMSANHKGTFGDADIESFLRSIYVTKLKAPAANQGGFFGGTQDITMAVMDYRSGITETVGFSCKSDFGGKATLFNASSDNTNFKYEIAGPITDNLMNHVNSLFNTKNKTNKKTGIIETRQEVAAGDRIRSLKDAGCSLAFVTTLGKFAKRNLVTSGGSEMPGIVAEALRHYYWDCEIRSECASIRQVMNSVISSNPAKYDFDDIDSIYNKKFANLMYDMFTGMRLGSLWDGRCSVNGGYIVMKSDGDVLAYHSCIADAFKEFLLSKLGFEYPSASRHKHMSVYKEGDRYFINFNLQIRFA